MVKRRAIAAVDVRQQVLDAARHLFAKRGYDGTAIQDVADRARAKKLNPDEVQAGTFTITNPGTFGAQFGLPVINQPQVSILGVGTIEKRAVVIDDMIGIRLMGYLTLGYDHRLVDGAVADQYMADVKQTIEHFDSNQV